MADCAFAHDTPVSFFTKAFPRLGGRTEAMAECGNGEAALDGEFRDKQVPAFETDLALYSMGGVANTSMVPMISKGLMRPLDAYVETYGHSLAPNQLIQVDGRTMAIGMMANAQHLMYRTDVFEEPGLAVPITCAEVIEAAQAIEAAGATDDAYGAGYAVGWTLAQQFVNLSPEEGGTFFDDANMATVNVEAGIAALETMGALSAHMDPEFLTMDSQGAAQHVQQGRIAMAFVWANRAGQIVDSVESQVADRLGVAAAPMARRAPRRRSGGTAW